MSFTSVIGGQSVGLKNQRISFLFSPLLPQTFQSSQACNEILIFRRILILQDRKHKTIKVGSEENLKLPVCTALAGKPTGEQLTSIEKAVQSAARWNSTLNKSRQESRKCCLDLQTFVIQYPKPPKGAQDSPKIGSYPISLIPGQFTDYYKRYVSHSSQICSQCSS